VKIGVRIKRGDVIGFVGNTGASTGPHCHYEVYKNKKPINPINFFFNDLTPSEYMTMLEIASRDNQSLD
jgi:murein DD-endopeptidase MepM/ murein hydrolase activator NlpD